MNKQMMNRLMALLRALVLILLLVAGLWLMDQVAQTTMAGRGSGAPSGAGSETRNSEPSRQSALPATDAAQPAQQGVTPDTGSGGKTVLPPPAGIPANNAVLPARKDAAAQAGSTSTKEAAATNPNSQSAQDTKETQGKVASPRIIGRPDGQYIATEPILFNTALATIRPVSLPPLMNVAALLKQRPEIKLLIMGYTDNLGLPENNQRVSNERATAVKDFLVSQGIDPSRLESKGMGSQNPIAPNDTQLGRQANRRIEFLITGPK